MRPRRDREICKTIFRDRDETRQEIYTHFLAILRPRRESRLTLAAGICKTRVYLLYHCDNKDLPWPQLFYMVWICTELL